MYVLFSQHNAYHVCCIHSAVLRACVLNFYFQCAVDHVSKDCDSDEAKDYLGKG